MLGVILCGGESTRMGKDKGLILRENKTWAEWAIEKMQTLDIPVVVSVNVGQREAYERALGGWMLGGAPSAKEELGTQTLGREEGAGRTFITDDPGLGVRGPLAGLMSVHLRYPAEDLFVLACDLPFMETGILRELYRRYRHTRSAQAWLFSIDDEPEPLCTIYTAGAMAQILRLHREGGLLRHSLKYALGQLAVDTLPVPERQRYIFTNVNTPL